nr:hypothetical protein [Mycobacterium tuberculosis]
MPDRRRLGRIVRAAGPTVPADVDYARPATTAGAAGAEQPARAAIPAGAAAKDAESAGPTGAAGPTVPADVDYARPATTAGAAGAEQPARAAIPATCARISSSSGKTASCAW